MRVLVAETDPQSPSSTTGALTAAGIGVRHVASAADTLADLHRDDIDAMVFDLDLPDMGGLDLLYQLRRAKTGVPVVIVAPHDSLDVKLKALYRGADDIMVRPIAGEELAARLQAILRRTRGVSDSIVAVGRLRIDLDTACVSVGGREVALTAKEYAVLDLLARHKGTTVAKPAIMRHLYGEDGGEPEIKIVDVFICKLRKKLAAATGGNHYLDTIWGRGYVLRDRESEAADAGPEAAA